MHSPLIVILLVGLVASTYAYHLSDTKKRSQEDEQRFLNFFQDLYADVLHKPLNHIVTNIALLGAQVLAGIAQNGIPAPGGRIMHPTEDQLRAFWQDFWNNAIKPPLESAIQSVSLLGAQVLAGISQDGINLSSLFGKRDTTEVDPRFLNALQQAFQQLYTDVLQKPLENALQTTALLGAQLLAGISQEGINLSSLFGKRDATEVDARFLDALTQALQQVFNQVLQKPLENALQTTALLGAQLLAGISQEGINLSSLFGKRELEAENRGEIIDNLVNHATNIFTNQLKPVVENALSAAALHLAGVLANFSQNGFGRR